MKNVNVYGYWFGDTYPIRVKEVQADLKSIKGINLIIGPSKEDHETLMKEFKYYRRAVESKKFAFAADVWRFWIYKKHGAGVYIDIAAAIFPDKFEKFLKEIETIDNFFIKETKYCIASDLFKISDTRVIDGILNFYKKNWWTKRIAPNILTRYVRKYVFKSKDWEEQKGINYLAWRINEMNHNGKTGYLKAGLGASWKFGVDKAKVEATKKDLEPSFFVKRHSKWFDNKRFESRWFALGIWIKKLTRNY